jgi:5'-nucleotidase
MRILITNDDGIHAEGLQIAHKIAVAITGKADDVWTVAPMAENSGVAHCISYTKPVRMEELDNRTFSVDGTPADCVLVALSAIMKDNPPDLVLSGVNRGNNISENTLYSGTVGATIEAVLHGVKAIALSQFYGPKNVNADNPFEAALVHGPQVVKHLLERGTWDDQPYAPFYNVNFPPMLAGDVKGAKITTQGRRPPSTNFRAQPFEAPNKRTYYWLTGGPQQVASEPGSDAHANLEGFISVTPCRADLTAHDLVTDLDGFSL